MNEFGNDDYWFRLITAGPSIFVDLYSDGVRTIGREEAEELRQWLDEAIVKMKAWEDQQ